MNRKFLSVAASAAIVASTLVFTGCGDSGSSSTPSLGGGGGNSGGNSGNNIAKLIDGAVYGVTVTGNASTSTTTNATGHFTFKDNEKLTFSLGGVKLGEYIDSNTSRPTGNVFGVAELDSASAADIAYILQALDVDGNHSNGINVSYVTPTIMSNAGITWAGIKDGTVATAINTPTSQFWNAINASKTAAGVNVSTTAYQAAFNTLTSGGKTAAYQTALNNVNKERISALAAGASASAFQLNATNIKGVNVTLGNGGWMYFSKNTTDGRTNVSMSSNLTAVPVGTSWWASIDPTSNVTGSLIINTSVDNMTVYNTDLNMTAGKAFKIEHSVTGSTTNYAANTTTVSKMRYNINVSELAGKTITLSDGKIIAFGTLNITNSLPTASIFGINTTNNINVTLYTAAGNPFNSANTTDTDGTNTTDKLVMVTNSTGDGYVNISFEADPALYAQGVVATVWSNITGYIKSAVAMLISLFS
jgi:hypothetical protein